MRSLSLSLALRAYRQLTWLFFGTFSSEYEWPGEPRRRVVPHDLFDNEPILELAVSLEVVMDFSFDLNVPKRLQTLGQGSKI